MTSCDALDASLRIWPETVEALLSDYVARAEASEIRLDQQIADYVRVSDDFATEHGSLKDEFPTL